MGETICSRKMSFTIFEVIAGFLLMAGHVTSFCVQVPNRDMTEYSCTGGEPFDLSVIPERTEKIRITNMSLPRITRETFSRYGENLWVLTCSHCGIREIDHDAFRSLVNLQQLRLDNNHLRSVESSWFEGMTYLTYLDLNYNEIERIDDNVYRNLPGLVEFRISGNRLECMNIEAMSGLPDLQRIFISKNPDFKCPNAMKKFLEDRNVTWDRDPKWTEMKVDTVGDRYDAHRDWRPSNGPETTTPYREKLVAKVSTTEEYYDYGPDDASPEMPDRENPPDVYTNRDGDFTVSPNFSRDYQISGATSESTNRESETSSERQNHRVPYPGQNWPITSPYPGQSWPITAPYPSQNWPFTGAENPPEYPDNRATSRPEIYHSEVNNRPDIMTSIDTANNHRNENAAEISPVTYSPNMNSPGVVWSDNSAETIPEIELPTIRDNVESVNAELPNNPVQPENSVTEVSDNHDRQSSANDDTAMPKILDKYQQVQEPESVTIVAPKKDTTETPLPNCSGNSSFSFAASLTIIATVILSRQFVTIFH